VAVRVVGVGGHKLVKARGGGLFAYSLH
jgi:hypothetical protein